MPTEIEVKVVLSEENYKKVLSDLSFRIKGVLDQHNIFFRLKDNELSKKAKFRIRLRSMRTPQLPTQWILCIKSSQGSQEAGLFVSNEIEEVVSEELAMKMIEEPSNLYNFIPKKLRDTLPELANNEHILLGDFFSKRRVIEFKDDLAIEADECLYPNGTFLYELEVESHDSSKAKNELVKYLDELNIPVEFSTIGKFARLMEVPDDKRISKHLEKLSR